MRFKNLLGLVAIGGAVYYAQKKRGADMSLNGIKNSLRSTFDNVKQKLSQATEPTVARAGDVGTSDFESSSRDYGPSGYSRTPSSAFGDGSNGSRKY